MKKSSGFSFSFGTKRGRLDDEEDDDDDSRGPSSSRKRMRPLPMLGEEEDNELPTTSSTTTDSTSAGAAGGGGEEEEADPLDAFMAGIAGEIEREQQSGSSNKPKIKRDDIEQADEHDDFMIQHAARRALELAAAGQDPSSAAARRVDDVVVVVRVAVLVSVRASLPSALCIYLSAQGMTMTTTRSLTDARYRLLDWPDSRATSRLTCNVCRTSSHCHRCTTRRSSTSRSNGASLSSQPRSQP